MVKLKFEVQVVSPDTTNYKPLRVEYTPYERVLVEVDVESDDIVWHEDGTICLTHDGLANVLVKLSKIPNTGMTKIRNEVQ